MWQEENFFKQFLNSNNIQLFQYFPKKNHKNKELFQLKIGSINDIKFLLESNVIQIKYKHIFKTFTWKIWNNYILIYYEFNEDILNKQAYWKTKTGKLIHDKIVYINAFIVNPETEKYDLLLEGETNFMIWLSECQGVLQ